MNVLSCSLYANVKFDHISRVSPWASRQRLREIVRFQFTARLLAVFVAFTLLLSCSKDSVAEKTFGPDRRAAATSLNELALKHQGQGQYAQAEILHKRALAIREEALGPDHPDVAQSLNGLAVVYIRQGHYQKAEPLYKRALAIREKSLGPDHPHLALSRDNLADLYSRQGLYAQAEPLYLSALTIRAKAFGRDHPVVAESVNSLAELYRQQGQYPQAEVLQKRALAIREKSFGPDHLDVTENLNNLANLYATQGLYTQAEPLYKRALAIREKSLGPDHPHLALSRDNLATLYSTQGLYTQAEPLYKRALAIREKSLGPDHPDLAISLSNLASLYRTQGQYAQAEPLFKRALAIHEKSLGPDHPDLASNLSNLASLYRTQGQYAQAEPLIKRALAIREKSLGPDHPDLASNLSNLAGLYGDQGQYAQAEPLYKRALAIYEKSLGPNHHNVATILNNLGGLYRDQQQFAQAEPLIKRALAIYEKALGPDHPRVATGLSNVATSHNDQGRHELAVPLYKRALTIRERSLGPNHPDVAHIMNRLAGLYATQGQYAQALDLRRKASAIYRQRIVIGGSNDEAVREASKNQDGFFGHLSLLLRNPDKEPDANIVDEAFQLVQLAQASGTAAAIAKMALRFAKGDDEMASLIKRKQDASDRFTREEAQLVTAAGKTPQQRNAAAEQRLREDIVAVGKEIAAVDAELIRRFPQYQELARSEPISVAQVRGLLRPGEAMLVYALGNSNFVWVVKPEGAIFISLSLNTKIIASKVADVRAQMELDNNNRVQRVNVGALHDLHQGLFAPVEDQLAGVNHIIVVPSGPLQSLPFAMLVTRPPPKINSDADYRKVDWLAKRYAFSVLPSVSSIQAFRQFAANAPAKEPFAGFGDPSIGDQSGTVRGKSTKRTKVDIATAFRSTVAVANDKMPIVGQVAEIADVEMIRNADSLPDTANELRAMAKMLKSDEKSIWLRGDATETNLKRQDLSKYRILAFATHGVMAGEVKGVGEPGLILTPPKIGTLEDDGYLTAGEIAKLKLNADWVILSACNTAASDGTTGAEGLSGMAKAFFYAGARSLLVSHWPVASEATVPLTTAMLEAYEANPALGKARAHRKAMLALMSTPDHPEYAHPLFWAPFVVVGEGGESRR